MNITALSLSELKALLSKVEADLADIDNEHKICNNIAKSFTGKQYNIEYNRKLKADIQIQLDILAFMDNGGKITFSDYQGAPLSTKSLKGARAGQRLYKRFN